MIRRIFPKLTAWRLTSSGITVSQSCASWAYDQLIALPCLIGVDWAIEAAKRAKKPAIVTCILLVLFVRSVNKVRILFFRNGDY